MENSNKEKIAKMVEEMNKRIPLLLITPQDLKHFTPLETADLMYFGQPTKIAKSDIIILKWPDGRAKCLKSKWQPLPGWPKQGEIRTPENPFNYELLEQGPPAPEWYIVYDLNGSPGILSAFTTNLPGTRPLSPRKALRY